jgi:5'-methylthioadenosine phosphorylase
MSTSGHDSPEPAAAVIGGSGFYDLPGLTEVEELRVDTPFGAPSDTLRVGRLDGRRVVFLARHGRAHTLLPGEVNGRANIYALKSVGVTRVIAVSAVGSLREHIAPGDIVTPHQLIDRTIGRPSTFFGHGVIAHVSMAHPICREISDVLFAAAHRSGASVHEGGTYLCIEGPQFSTRAESELWRTWGADVVGMTNLPEAKLAREAELCYATLALPSDYDCWRDDGDHVTANDVMATLRKGVDRARAIVALALTNLDTAWDPARTCGCQTALDAGLVTAPEAIGPEARARLAAILARRLARRGA